MTGFTALFGKGPVSCIGIHAGFFTKMRIGFSLLRIINESGLKIFIHKLPLRKSKTGEINLLQLIWVQDDYVPLTLSRVEG